MTRFKKGQVPHNKKWDGECLVEGCFRDDMKAFGLCHKHYRKRLTRKKLGQDYTLEALATRLPRTEEHIKNNFKNRNPSNSLKGKTFEEIYGEERALLRKKAMQKRTVSDEHKRLLSVWSSMKRRCENKDDKSYHLYGARGICIKWECFEDFERDMLKDYRKGLKIDRVNNDGHYQKTNCRWVTDEVQANNKRNNVYWSHQGESLTIAQWAKKLDVNYSTLWMGINKYGKSIDSYKEKV